MSLLLDVARVSAAANILLLLALVYVWASVYGEVRSRQTLGTLVFALFILAENALALYYYLSGLAIPEPAVRAMMYLQLLETAGIAFLVYVTYE